MHEGAVNAVAFSPDGRTALTASSDKTARLWDVETGRPRGAAWKHEEWSMPWHSAPTDGPP